MVICDLRISRVVRARIADARVFSWSEAKPGASVPDFADRTGARMVNAGTNECATPGNGRRYCPKPLAGNLFSGCS